MDQSTEDSFYDSAKGCLFGALCGDALGSFLEFKSAIKPEEIDQALGMPGGGPFSLDKGQITDDGELTLCLGHGLVEGKGVLDLNKIAKYYGRWMGSKPFDVGMTIRTAMNGVFISKEDFETTDEKGLANKIREGAAKSLNSQSNGALMRITPLCIWATNLDRDDLIECVIQETKLTHPNQDVIDMSIVYAYTVQYLLRNKGDYKGAYLESKRIVEYIGNREIKKWIDDIEKGILPRANEKIGWAKIALSHSLFFLKEGKGYEEAMRHMLSKGGDTDTNCCIVGGMLGALHGFKKIPEQYTKAVILLEPEKGKKARPHFLNPGSSADDILKDIIRYLPSKATIVARDQTE